MFIYTYTERESVCGLENEKRRMSRKNSILISGWTKYIYIGKVYNKNY